MSAFNKFDPPDIQNLVEDYPWSLRTVLMPLIHTVTHMSTLKETHTLSDVHKGTCTFIHTKTHLYFQTHLSHELSTAFN